MRSSDSITSNLQPFCIHGSAAALWTRVLELDTLAALLAVNLCSQQHQPQPPGPHPRLGLNMLSSSANVLFCPVLSCLTWCDGLGLQPGGCTGPGGVAAPGAPASLSCQLTAVAQLLWVGPLTHTHTHPSVAACPICRDQIVFQVSVGQGDTGRDSSPPSDCRATALLGGFTPPGLERTFILPSPNTPPLLCPQPTRRSRTSMAALRAVLRW